jgi:hypothetical protein
VTESILDAIALELARLRATTADVGEAESIGVNDEQDGWSSLGSSESRRDFYWYGRAEVLLERLGRLPEAAGPHAIREEFRSHFPG